MSFKETWLKCWHAWGPKEEPVIIEEEAPIPKPTLPVDVAEYFMDHPLELGCFPARAVSHKRMIQVLGELNRILWSLGWPLNLI
jgi:hypothetical protein